MGKTFQFGLLAALLLAVSSGCHAQIPANPTVFTCAPVGSYVALNQATPAAGLTYTDSAPPAGQYCYTAQSVIAATGQISIASNVTAPAVVNGTNSVEVTWRAPASGPTPSGYVISRAPAIASTLGAPALNNGTVASNGGPARPQLQAPAVEPASAGFIYQMKNEPQAPVLTATVTK